MTGPFQWDPAKNDWLQQMRGFGFQDVVDAIEAGRILDDHPHLGARYQHQRMLVVEIQGEAIAVPYVASVEGTFFKTAFPNRKMRRKYLGR